MDAKQLQCFMMVAEMGSFTGAAKRLYLTTPGAVKIIDRLEEELSVQLFVRMRTGVCLTPAGHALLRYAPAYIRRTEQILSEVKRAETRRENQIEVCMTWGLLSFFPGDFLSRFVCANPDVQLSAHNYSLKECEQILTTCRADIGLYFGSMGDPALEVLFHRSSPLVALMAQDHPLTAKQELTMTDLKGYRLIVVNNDPGVTEELQEQLSGVGCEIQLILDGAEWIQTLDLVRNARYVTFCLPPRTLGQNLTIRPVSDLTVKVNFNMAALRNITLSAAEQRFVDYMLDLMEGKYNAG